MVEVLKRINFRNYSLQLQKQDKIKKWVSGKGGRYVGSYKTLKEAKKDIARQIKNYKLSHIRYCPQCGRETEYYEDEVAIAHTQGDSYQGEFCKKCDYEYEDYGRDDE